MQNNRFIRTAIHAADKIPAELLDSKCRTYRCWVQLFYRVYQNSDRPLLGLLEHEPTWKDYMAFVFDMGKAPSDKHVLRRKISSEGFTKSNTIWDIPNPKSDISTLKPTKKYRSERKKFLETIGAKTGKLNSKHQLYGTWYNLLSRCFNEEAHGYSKYQHRKPPESWLNFENFVKDVGEKPSKDLSIDRIDNLKPYSKDNVRWATALEQASNKDSAITLNYEGIDYSMEALSRLRGVAYETINQRRKKGWPISEIVRLKPSEQFLKERAELGKLKQKQRQGIFVTIGTDTFTLKEWAKQNNISYSTLRSRVQRGQSPEQAIKELAKKSKSFGSRP